mgnify:CR=1 FL=1
MPLPPDDPRVRILKTGFVVYTHADGDRAQRFLTDFGLTVRSKNPDGDIFWEGYGPEPFCYWPKQAPQGQPSSFGGAAYVVEERKELEKAAQVPGASSIKPLDGPGGGEIVSIKDPWGFYVHFVYGDAWVAAEPEASSREVPDFVKHKVNYEFEEEKPRKGKFLRLAPGPAPVHHWGHYGFTYPPGEHDAVYDFYTTHFAIAPSDQLYRESEDGKKTTVVSFFHIDRGTDYTDHHCFFIKPAKPGDSPSVAHSAFEVHDFDVQQLGHQHLTGKGYEICWGVGRHILGSQVFDYWFDTSKNVVEHYCDGVSRELDLSRLLISKR